MSYQRLLKCTHSIGALEPLTGPITSCGALPLPLQGYTNYQERDTSRKGVDVSRYAFTTGLRQVHGNWNIGDFNNRRFVDCLTHELRCGVQAAFPVPATLLIFVITSGHGGHNRRADNALRYENSLFGDNLTGDCPSRFFGRLGVNLGHRVFFDFRSFFKLWRFLGGFWGASHYDPTPGVAHQRYENGC